MLLAAAIASVQGRPIAQADALFSFHSSAWLNLHHILWSKGEGAPLPADLPQPERRAWAAGLEFYALYSKRDLIFDEELIAIKEPLRTAEARTSLDGLPIKSGVRTTLERLRPIYQKHWWPAHDRTNREWIAAVRPLIDRQARRSTDPSHALTASRPPTIPCGSTCQYVQAVSVRTNRAL